MGAIRLRSLAIGSLVLFAVVNVAVADVADNQVHKLVAIQQGDRPPTSEPEQLVPTPQVVPIDVETLEGYLEVLYPLLAAVAGLSLAVWVTWLIFARRRLLALGVARRGRRSLAGEVLVDVLVPVRVIDDTIVRSSRPEDLARTRGRRLLLLATGWATIVAFVVLALLLLVRADDAATIAGRISRDRLTIALGVVGLALAIVSALIAWWVGASQRDLAIGEPTDTWAGRGT
jgi:hypothetical protein